MTAAVGEWAQISGTTTNASIGNYGGTALRDDGQRVEICMALGGGHTSGQWLSDNRVSTLRLDVSSPAWVDRLGASDATGWDSAGTDTDPYFPSDGRPVPRHTYSTPQWVPSLGGYIFGGTYSGSDGSGSIPAYSLFVPSGDSGGDWESFGESLFEATPAGVEIFACAQDADGILYSPAKDNRIAGYKLNPSTRAWSTWYSAASPLTTFGQIAYDSTRGNFFQLAPLSWSSPTSTICAFQITTGGTRTAIGFSSSAAWTEFQSASAQMYSPWMVYDADADRFYFYNGTTGSLSGQGQKVYVITPNGTTTWDMSVMSVTGVTPGSLGTAGVQNRWHYVPRWRCLFLLLPSAAVYYLRVA